MAPRPLTGQPGFTPSFVTTPADSRARIRTPFVIPERELKAPQGTHPTFGMELPKGEMSLDVLYELVDKVQRTFPHFSRESVEEALRDEVKRQGVSLGSPKSLWEHLDD